MAKAKKTAVAKKAASKTAAKKTVVRSTAATQSAIDKAPETNTFEVLEPFWFGGAVIKPGCFIEMTDAEAVPFQDAGVLGTEPGEVPDPNSSEQSGAQEGNNANGAKDDA